METIPVDEKSRLILADSKARLLALKGEAAEGLALLCAEVERAVRLRETGAPYAERLVTLWEEARDAYATANRLQAPVNP